VDGIKPNLASASQDDTLASAPITVDLLHPSEVANQPTATKTEPVTNAVRAASVSPLTPPAPSSRISPITPPRIAPLDPSFEMVTIPRAAVQEPVVPPVPPVPTDPVTPPAAKPVVPDEKPEPFVMPPVDEPAAPVAVAGTSTTKQPGSKRGLVIIIILILILLAGSAAYLLLAHKAVPATSVANPPIAQTQSLAAVPPTNLAQKSATAPISGGGLTATAPIFTATLPTSARSGSAQLQVEIESVGTAFTGTATLTGDAVSANGSDLSLQATKAGLADGSYHWQARTQVGTATSSWVAFNTAGTASPDFSVKSTAPTAPALTSVTGGTLNGTTVIVTDAQPTLAGKTDPGNTVSLSLSPDNSTLSPAVASDGSWSVGAGQVLSNGDHTLVITATDSAGNHSQSTYTLRVNPATAAVSSISPTTGKTTVVKLAPTGDSTTLVSLLGMTLLVASGTGLYLLRRQDAK
jgi:hypothetical protein